MVSQRTVDGWRDQSPEPAFSQHQLNITPESQTIIPASFVKVGGIFDNCRHLDEEINSRNQKGYQVNAKDDGFLEFREGMGSIMPEEIYGIEDEDQSSAETHEEREPQKVPVVVVPDATAGEVAVMVSLQHAAVADLAVPRPRRHQHIAHIAVVPQVRLLFGGLLQVRGQGIHGVLDAVAGPGVGSYVVHNPYGCYSHYALAERIQYGWDYEEHVVCEKERGYHERRGNGKDFPAAISVLQ